MSSARTKVEALVGESPIAFLTGWRLALAADLLRTGDDTIATVAHRVGYSTPFAFSNAFKRAYGFSPNEHRHQAVQHVLRDSLSTVRDPEM